MVSCFDNIFETTNPTHRPLMEVLYDMGYSKKASDPELKSTVERIRRASTPEEQDRLKVRLLPVICPSGTFTARNDSSIIDYNGIICLDLDDVPDPRVIKTMAMLFPHTLASIVSPTGTGVKVFVLTDLTESARHSDAYHHLGDVMGFKKRVDIKFDSACSNPSRACFMSYDSDIRVNENVTPYHIDLATLPVYTPPAKSSVTVSTGKLRTDIATTDIDFPDPLTDYKDIREAIKDSHTLFEKYYPMVRGVRNTNLYVLAFFFRLDGIPEDIATDYLVGYYVDPSGGFSVDEIKRTVHSAYTR